VKIQNTDHIRTMPDPHLLRRIGPGENV